MLNIILGILILSLAVGLIVLRIYFVKKCRNQNKGFILIPVSSKTVKLTLLVLGYYMEEIVENKNYSKKIILVKTDGSLNCITADRLARQYSIVESIDINKLNDFILNQEKKRKTE